MANDLKSRLLLGVPRLDAGEGSPDVAGANRLMAEAHARIRDLEDVHGKAVGDLLAAARADLANRLSWSGPPMGVDEARQRIGVLEEVAAALRAATDPSLQADDVAFPADRAVESPPGPNQDAETAPTAEDRIAAAARIMSSTQPSWERRCHAMAKALGLDFGDPTPDMPEQSGWYARNLALAESQKFDAICKAITAEARVRELEPGSAAFDALRELAASVPADSDAKVEIWQDDSAGRWHVFAGGPTGRVGIGADLPEALQDAIADPDVAPAPPR